MPLRSGNRQKQAETKMRAIADSNRTAYRLGKLNGETRAAIMPTTAAAAMPQGLELQ
jgi:hypothetical protein